MRDMTRGAEKLAPDVDENGPNYRPLGSGELADPWQLGDFFEALGPVMRLPAKDDDMAGDPVSRGRRRAARNKRAALLAGTALVLLAAVALGPAVLRALRLQEAVPASLYGRWVAGPGRYAGRSFELTGTTLRLGLGVRESVHPITGVKHRDSSGTAMYTIRYRDAESVLEFGLAVVSDSVALVRNVANVAWVKAAP
jgi:hypothetical protein